jgi:hypothetical protein
LKEVVIAGMTPFQFIETHSSSLLNANHSAETLHARRKHRRPN